MDVYRFLEDNLRVIAGKSPDFASWFNENKHKWYDLRSKVGFNRHGWLDLEFKSGKKMMESMPPKMFYSKWRPKNYGIRGASIICGCNLGYGLNTLLAATEHGHRIAVTDPNPAMLALCLGITDYTKFVDQGRIVFFPPDKQSQERVLSYMDLQFYHGRIYFWADMPSMQLGPEYDRQNKICRDVLHKYNVQTGTLRKKQNTVVGNELDNYARAFSDGVLSGIKGDMNNKSALILGAGPSLEKFGPKLAGQPVDAFYAAGLQTLPALARLGIKPDLCMAIDFTKDLLKPMQKVEQEWLRDIPLIYTTKVDPEVVASYPGPKMAVWTRGGLGTMVFKKRGYLLDTGGSVNVALARLMLEMGISDIAFAGMDFGWKGDFSHAKGHHAGEKRKDNASGKFEVRFNSDNEKVYSALPYLTSLWELEKTVQEEDARFYNLFGGYMDISGADRVGFEALHQLLGARKNASKEYSSILNYIRQKMQKYTAKPVFEPRGNKWSVSLKRVMKRMERLFSNPGKNGLAIRRTLSEIRMFVSQDPLYLTYLQPEIMDISAYEVFNKTYARNDYVRIKSICDRIVKKVRRMDRAVGYRSMHSAA